MPGWLEWVLGAAAAWFVGATVLGLLLARMLSMGSASAAPGNTPRAETARAMRPRPRVLVVDDDAPLRSLLLATLAADEFDVREAGSSEEAREVMRSWRPAVLLLDVSLPGLDGLSFCTEIARTASDVSVILLTGEEVSHTTARLAGAKGVVRKPFSPLELLSLIGLVLEGKDFVSEPPTADDGQLLIYARDLANIAKTERRQRKLLQDAYRQTATALADAVDARDRATGLHAQRVRRYALELADVVAPSLVEDPSLEYGFLLHDVGKIGISDLVLLKPGPLSSEEQELVRMHPTIGAQILRDVALLHGAGLDVVLHHHERWDGAGYPRGLAGEEIPLGARIFAVADTLDAMTSDRPYRPALAWSEAAGEIVAQSGRQFDPEIVRAFVAREDDLRAVYEDLSLVA
jgi:response regulator RpfG family c-di-GMP phosphodiesterase